jgi:hypothetical protein
VPYPHQNLGELERALGDLDELLASLAELSGRAMPEIPAFGAAGVPPAAELAIAADPTGERFVVAARVYPIPALLARWAGRLAGNPLLTGGSAEVGGRRVEASWSGSDWIVRSEAAVGLDGLAARPDGAAAALARLDLARAHGWIPAGAYRVERDGGDLRLAGGDPAALERLEALGATAAPLPLVVGQSFAAAGAVEGRFLALVPGIESVADLPGAVAASRGEKRWRLPGERVVSLVRDEVPTRRLGGWKLTALERRSLAAGGGLVELAGRLEGAPPLDLGVWIETRGARRLVEQVSEALEQVPILGAREARPWRAAGEVLTTLDRYQRLTAFSSSSPPALVVRLWRRSPGAGSEAARASSAN